MSRNKGCVMRWHTGRCRTERLESLHTLQILQYVRQTLSSSTVCRLCFVFTKECADVGIRRQNDTKRISGNVDD